MRRRIVAAVSAAAAGLALGVMPATGAFASSDISSDRGCSDWSWHDGRHDDRDDCDDRDDDDYFDFVHHRHFDRHFDSNVLIILVDVT